MIKNNLGYVNGGGINVQNSDLSLANTSIINNTAAQKGGGIFVSSNNR